MTVVACVISCDGIVCTPSDRTKEHKLDDVRRIVDVVINRSHESLATTFQTSFGANAARQLLLNSIELKVDFKLNST